MFQCALLCCALRCEHIKNNVCDAPALFKWHFALALSEKLLFFAANICSWALTLYRFVHIWPFLAWQHTHTLCYSIAQVALIYSHYAFEVDQTIFVCARINKFYPFIHSIMGFSFLKLETPFFCLDPERDGHK